MEQEPKKGCHRMILVTGAAGKTGRAIIRTLSEKKEGVRALVNRAEQIKTVETCGAVEVVVADMRDVDAVIQSAKAVNKIYHICPNMSPDEVEIGLAAISAAQAASVDQFVYHSVLHPQTQKMPHHWLKLQVEELLLESNLPYTILQPTIYMQNVLAEWERIVEDGIYSVPYSIEMTLSMVDLEDVAKAAAHVLTETGHLGATYELAGPYMISAVQVAEIISKKLERRVKAETKPIEAWVEGASASGLGKYQIETLVKMFQYYDTFGFPGNSRVLSHLLGRPPADFRVFIKRVIRLENTK